MGRPKNRTCSKGHPRDYYKSGQCRVCAKEKYEISRDTVLKTTRIRRYKITEEVLNDLFDSANHRCEICGVTGLSGLKSDRLCVDHNHETSKLRGVLCNACNRGIGYLKDNPVLLRLAASYLDRTDG